MAIQYTYREQPIEILHLMLEDDEWIGDDMDFCPYAHIRFSDGETDTVSIHRISPDPGRVLLGLPQVHNILHCGVYTQVEDGQPNMCRECGEVIQ